MSNLIKYEAACRALAACKAVDEVKNLLDKAEAMRLYGRMAKDKTLEMDAAEIRMRAERRLGQMLAEQKAAGGMNKGQLKQGPALVNNEDGKASPTLADVGISYDLSSRAQKMAAVPEAEFEAEVGEWRDRVQVEGERVSTRLQKAGARAQQETPPAPEACGPSDEELALDECAELVNAERCRILLESDEPLAAAVEKVKTLTAMVYKLEWTNRGLVNEVADLTRRLKASMAKLERLAKESA